MQAMAACSSRQSVLLCAICALVSASTSTSHAQTSYIRPPHTEHARMVRWLVAESDWGTLSTISKHLHGAPFGNLVSFSDGPRGQSTGRLLFYLTDLDASAADLEVDNRTTLSIGEIQMQGACGIMDPEDPTCAKVSMSGRMGVVAGDALPEAERLLFQRHPQMRDWPRGHNFRVYELHMEVARLLDFYGGAAEVSPDDYYAAHLDRADKERPLAAR